MSQLAVERQREPIDDDLVRPFQFDGAGVRGRLVRLGATADTIVRQHGYPALVSGVLGELLALCAALASTIKFDGLFTVQAKGEGPLRMLVADFVSPGQMRGYAQYDEAEIAALDESPAPSLPRLMGGGHIAFTVDQGIERERYQGIVELTGSSLAECALNYFRTSEQIDSSLLLAAGERNGDGGAAWRAGALLLQRVPQADPALLARAPDSDAIADEAHAEAWRAAAITAATARADELLDPDLSGDALLYRLFHERPPRVFTPVPVAFGCRCSRARAERVLSQLPAGELRDLAIDNRLDVACEFCNAHYDFPLNQFVGRETSP